MNIDLIRRIELALGFKLKDWQINYILDIPMVLDMKIAGRQTGKTLAHVIKILFSKDEPLHLYNEKEIMKIYDWYSGHDCGRYAKWYREYVIDIYMLLVKNGIVPRRIFVTESELKAVINNKYGVESERTGGYL